MQFTDLILALSRLAGTKRVTTAFINGAPGSGKTTLLNQLAKELPKTISYVQVLGPYSTGSFKTFTDGLLDDFRKAAFLEDQHSPDRSPDLVGFFNWLKQHLIASNRQTLVILLDLDYASLDIDSWRSWFSSIRSLEQSWQDGPARLLFIIASFWNHNLLEPYYRKIRLSFPYTVGENYFLWDGISVEQMDGMLKSYYPDIPAVVPYGSLLHEITGGHPGAAVDILNHSPEGQPLSIPAILSAAQAAAANGDMAQTLANEWSQLPERTRLVIHRLLLMHQIPITHLRLYVDGLCSAGLLSEKVVAGTTYGVLRSWYVECVARNHLKEIGIEDTELDKVEMAEMSPPLTSVNTEAYRIINDIENLARNFAIVHMSFQRSPGEPLLMDRVKKYDNYRREYICAHERAVEWKEHSEEAGMPVDLNPLIAYLSIKDLPKLIGELADELNSDQWKKIAAALESTGGIRDAVMHNQIIDDAAYIRLFELRAAIYEAMIPVNQSG